MKAVFFDIDGTLIDYGVMSEVSEKTIEAINKLKSSGYKVIVATGRPLCFINDEIRRIEPDGYITCNGANVILDGKRISHKPIDKKELDDLRAFFEENNVSYLFESQDVAFTLDRNAIHAVEQWDAARLGVKSIKDYKDYNNEDLYKVSVYCADEVQYDKTYKHLSKNYNIVNFKIKTSFDLFRDDIDKCVGVDEVIKKLGIKKEDTIAFGDGRNDHLFLEHAGTGVAMGNASDELKKIADEVTKSVEEDGIYTYLKDKGLI